MQNEEFSLAFCFLSRPLEEGPVFSSFPKPATSWNVGLAKVGELPVVGCRKGPGRGGVGAILFLAIQVIF